MVRNRPTDQPISLLKRFSEKFAGAMLLASAIMVWAIIILAITFLMIDNGQMKEKILQHTESDKEITEWRQYVRDELTKLDNRAKGNAKRLEKLESAAKQEP